MIDILSDSRVGRLIEQALQEDIGFGDITSEAVVAEQQISAAVILPKENGIISGVELFLVVFQYIDGQIRIEFDLSDGNMCAAGQPVGKMEGPARSVLTGERVALNFLQRMSGIATMTHKFVHAVDGTNAKITDTRKTTPAMRILERKAVVDGGGVNHRFGLDQMVLIKDNHIRAAGNIGNAVARCVQYLHDHHIEAKIEVETTSLAQVEEALLCAGVNRIMLDNFLLNDMATAVRR
ncbi:MAG: carboxylating nicotinate-nucleotide diphosphorylase, partial [Bacteroidota bacterium]|nr:carboxylating nicotinate-nucleotide diphosphorylase [Bacteroidota bacterium]